MRSLELNQWPVSMGKVALAAGVAVLMGGAGQALGAEPVTPGLRPGPAAAAPIKGSGVKLAYDVAPTAGAQGARVTLRLSGVSDPAGATVHYTIQGPGRILAQDAKALAPGQEAVRQVTVAFDPSQRVYLNVFTRQGDRAGVVAVPLGAVPPGVAPSGKLSVNPGARPLILLPAETR